MSAALRIYLVTLWVVFAIGLPIPENAEDTPQQGWVAEPRGRGTLSIITSCGVTLGLCVWTAIHPDVHAGSTTWQRLKTRLRWMLRALHTPDEVVMSAYNQWREAERIHSAWMKSGLNDYTKSDGVSTGVPQINDSKDVNRTLTDKKPPSSSIHGGETYFISVTDGSNTDTEKAQDQGFNDPDKASTPEIPLDDRQNTTIDHLEQITSENQTGSSDTSIQSKEPHSHSPKKKEKAVNRLGKEGAFFIVMHGFVRQTDKVKPKPWDAQMFIDALGWQGENISEQLNRNDIIDKGKASTLAKLVVCVQASWLVVQLIARKAADLPITLLELHVAIHILIAAVVYGFWWNKPLDVNEPITLNFAYGPAPEVENLSNKVKGLLDFSDTFSPLRWLLKPRKDPFSNSSAPTRIGSSSETLSAPEEGDTKIDISPDQSVSGRSDNSDTDSNAPSVFSEDITHILGNNWQALIFYLIYAGLHATAWNSQFPTVVECWIWRCSCLVIGAVPIGLVFLMFIQRYFKHGKVLTRCNQIIYHTLKIVYLLGSACLLVESFISLRCLPSGAYKTLVWENYIPHF